MRKRRRQAAFAQQLAFKKRLKKRTGTKLAVGELKFHDVSVSDTVIASGGSIDTLSLVVIAQGTTESKRIGRRITIRHIGWRYTLLLPTTQTVASTSDTARIIIFVDHQTNGAAATVTGILETANYQSFNQLANKSRFRVLFDKTWHLNATAGAGNDAAESGINFAEHRIDGTWFKNVNIPIEYDNSFDTGVIGTQRTNNIGVLTISAAGLVGLAASTFRLRFSDI